MSGHSESSSEQAPGMIVTELIVFYVTPGSTRVFPNKVY